MRRREFLALLGGAPAFWSSVGAAQSRMARVGIVDDAPIWDHFRQALRELGRAEGRNIVLEYRVADGDPGRLLAAVKDLAGARADVIAVFGSTAAKAGQAAGVTVPIVAISIGDPVGIGLVKSLAHPGGNITGNTVLGPDLVPKRLQILKEVLPRLARLALLWNPNNASNRALFDQLQAVAPGLGVAVVSAEARSDAEFDGLLDGLAAERPDAVLTTNDPVHQRNMHKVIEFQLAQRVPGMFQLREQVVAGGMMSYGASLPDLFRRGAVYAHKILQGTAPADLPIEQPVTFELAVNLKTAKALGIEIPPSLLVRADEVIE